MDDGIRSATTMSPRPENSTHSSLSFRFAKSSPCGGGGHDVCAAAAAFLHLRRRQGRGVHISFPVRFVRKGRVALVYRRRDFCVAGTSTNLRGTPMPNCSRLSVHSLLSLQYSVAAIRTVRSLDAHAENTRQYRTEYSCIAITLTRAGDHHRHSWNARRVAPFALPQLTLLAVWDQAEPHEAHRLRRQHERPKPAPVVP
jgi:hypothetical protein